MSQACRLVIPGKGAMIAVGLGEDDVIQYINKITSGVISVACVNSPVSTTVSGKSLSVFSPTTRKVLGPEVLGHTINALRSYGRCTDLDILITRRRISY